MTISTKELEETTQARSRSRRSKSANTEKRPQTERLGSAWIRDAAAVLTLFVAIALLLTLISYDPTDPSIFYSDTSKHIPDNLMGKIGANLAAISYQTIGFVGFVFPLAMIGFGWMRLRNREIRDLFFKAVGGTILVLDLLAFLGSLAPIPVKNDMIMPGGVVGIALWRFFSEYLNWAGSYLLIFGTTVLGILIATKLSLRELGTLLRRLTLWCGSKLQAYTAKMREAHATRRKEAMQQKIIARELKKIEEEFATPDQQTERGEPIHVPDPGEVVTQPMDEGEYDEMGVDFAHDPAGVAQIDPEPGTRPTVPRSVVMPPRETDVRPPAPSASQSTASASPAQAPPADEIRVNKALTVPKESQESFQFVQEINTEWVYPNSFFFEKPTTEMKIDESELIEKAKALEIKLGEFSITGQMKEIHPGPVVTTYEFKPDAGIKYSKIVGMSDDLCLALGAESIRIDRMPGRSSIGMEVPNNKRELITFREMVEGEKFRKSKSLLLLTLGKTIDGSPFYADLAKMPHLLIAGQTGSGKSVGINAMICSMLMRARPDEVKLIMIDPKMVEMGIYSDIPHLLTPVVTDPNEASNALKWAVAEMERRYRLLASYNFRNLEQYNLAVSKGQYELKEGDEPLEPLPFIVVFIDEMADLMMVARGEVEESVARLAQKSRAIGIHLILATQRPSVDIITGVIKSNLPSRLSYRVSQKNDSRIILDGNGAERLLGKGDGLFLGPGTSRLVRIHAPFLSEKEVLELVTFLKRQGRPDYNESVVRSYDEVDDEGGSVGGGGRGSAEDDLYDKAARLVIRSGQASVSYLQRKLKVGYNRAARLVDLMEDEGLVGPNNGSKAREILVPADYFDEIDNRIP